MKRTRSKRTGLQTVAAVLFLTVAAARADVIQVDISQQALLAGRDIWLDSGATVAGNAASGRSFSTGSSVTLQSAYAGASLWLGSDATVRGTVLANGSADASNLLDFSGPSWTGSSVWFGRDAAVNGQVLASGTVGLDSRAQVVGDVRSNSTVWIGSNSTVAGNVSTGLNKNLSAGGSVAITGEVTHQALTVDTLGTISLGQASGHGEQGSTNVSRGRHSTTTLDAGDYKDISIDDGSVLNLSAGTYTLRRFWLDNDSVVNVDTSAGDVVIDALDRFGLGNRVQFVTSGAGKLIINVWDDDVWFGDDVQMPGEVRVWEGDFGAGKNLSFMGSIWARDNISLGANSSIAYGNWSSPVPEPTTTALLVVGGGALLARRRRQKAVRSR